MGKANARQVSKKTGSLLPKGKKFCTARLYYNKG